MSTQFTRAKAWSLKTSSAKRRMRAQAEACLLSLCWKQNYICPYCGCRMVVVTQQRGVPDPEEKATVEHVIPLSKGGTNRKNNLVAACVKCNQARGNQGE